MLKIKLFRMSKGLSQWELSRSVGMSQGRYSMIERGLIDPTEAERAGLAHVLSANPATLFRAAVRSWSAVGVFQAEVMGLKRNRRPELRTQDGDTKRERWC